MCTLLVTLECLQYLCTRQPPHLEHRAALQTRGPDGVLLWPCGDFSSWQACRCLCSGGRRGRREKTKDGKKRRELIGRTGRVEIHKPFLASRMLFLQAGTVRSPVHAMWVPRRSAAGIVVALAHPRTQLQPLLTRGVRMRVSTPNPRPQAPFVFHPCVTALAVRHDCVQHGRIRSCAIDAGTTAMGMSMLLWWCLHPTSTQSACTCVPVRYDVSVF